MSTVTGLGTTFNLPNYHGEMIAVTPTDTPLLSLAGGIGGGKQTTSTKFEWQTEDLRDPEIRPRLEGGDAPEAEARARANVENVVQIFHEKISTSYTKQAATGQYATAQAAPFISADGEANPVMSEHDHQIVNALKTIARDVNYAFWHGRKVVPANNSTARQTAGLLEVLTTNRVATGEVTDATAATDTITKATNGLSNGDKVVFTKAPSTLRTDRVYYVVSAAAGTFKVAAAVGGAAITIGTAAAGEINYIKAATALSATALDELMQSVFDNGGISESETATLFVPSRQKRAISAAYADAYGKSDLFAGSRNVAGQNITTIETNFGVLNVVIDRALPPDALAVVSLEQIDPVFLEVPNKGVLFVEELAKTGASDNSQVYGEVGLKYGNEFAHGVMRGLAV